MAIATVRNKTYPNTYTAEAEPSERKGKQDKTHNREKLWQICGRPSGRQRDSYFYPKTMTNVSNSNTLTIWRHKLTIHPAPFLSGIITASLFFYTDAGKRRQKKADVPKLSTLCTVVSYLNEKRSVLTFCALGNLMAA